MVAKFEDKTLSCEECGTEFIWDASEQAYFAKKGFEKVPKRCRACRAQKKAELDKEKKNEKEITCVKCGKKGATSQEIKEGEEIFCMDCYLKERENPTPDSSQESTTQDPTTTTPPTEFSNS